MSLAKLVDSIRAQIPDPSLTGNSEDDGDAFTTVQLLDWVNDAAEIISISAPIVEDWFAIGSESGMDVYELPDHVLSVEQLWYDNWPCWRAPELDALFVTKISSRSYFFGPHSRHKVPRLHVWPAADRTAETDTLNGAITATDKIITVNDISSFRPYAFLKIDDEVILYRTTDEPNKQFKQILRGQGGTTAASHANSAVVNELNVFFKCFRIPVRVATVDDVFELPRGMNPLVELYVIAKVREAEQNYQIASSDRKEFYQMTERLANKANVRGLRQGTQVRTAPPGPALWYGRVYVP